MDNTNSESEVLDPFVNYIRPFPSRNNCHQQPKFNGRCRACRKEGHYNENCFFLKKLQKCLSFLGIKPNLARENKNKYKNNNYNQRHNIVRSLVDESFIPYDNVNLDIFIKDIDNDRDFEHYK